MIEYLVVGVYADNHGRFAVSVNAETPEDAEDRALKQAEGDLIVAAVITGSNLVVAA